ncbi:MAG TPA: cation:proton antiporter, partial [Gemmatimonadales bacterium]|nr:cation:proton antiporter [Gemmatimonadales bacterium]
MNRSSPALPGRRLWPAAVLLLLAVPRPLWADTEASETVSLFLILAAMLACAKLLGELCERLGQPAVLGELAAGILLGPSVLHLIPAGDSFTAQTIELLSGLGVVLLLFEVGLETDLKATLSVGAAATAVAVMGVLLPFA